MIAAPSLLLQPVARWNTINPTLLRRLNTIHSTPSLLPSPSLFLPSDPQSPHVPPSKQLLPRLLPTPPKATTTTLLQKPILQASSHPIPILLSQLKSSRRALRITIFKRDAKRTSPSWIGRRSRSGRGIGLKGKFMEEGSTLESERRGGKEEGCPVGIWERGGRRRRRWVWMGRGG